MHTWDVAVSVGKVPVFDDDVVAAALAVAEQIPDGANRERPGASFAPRVSPAPGGPPFDRLLALVGRSPGWTPPVA